LLKVGENLFLKELGLVAAVFLLYFEILRVIAFIVEEIRVLILITVLAVVVTRPLVAWLVAIAAWTTRPGS
jgi:hypothetical protein